MICHLYDEIVKLLASQDFHAMFNSTVLVSNGRRLNSIHVADHIWNGIVPLRLGVSRLDGNLTELTSAMAHLLLY